MKNKKPIITELVELESDLRFFQKKQRKLQQKIERIQNKIYLIKKKEKMVIK